MRIEKTVLLIDDDKDDLELLEGALKVINEDHKIVEATNGEEGLAKLRNLILEGELPCLIVLDINMPKMDGREFLTELRKYEKLRTIPIVIFSTSINSVEVEFFNKMGVFTFFNKPRDFDQLCYSLRAILQRVAVTQNVS